MYVCLTSHCDCVICQMVHNAGQRLRAAKPPNTRDRYVAIKMAYELIDFDKLQVRG